MRGWSRPAVLACLALLSTCTIGTAQTASPAGQPPAPDEVGIFRFDRSTGQLTRLERLASKVDNSGRTYSAYLPGPTSTVEIKTGEQIAFLARWSNVPPDKTKGDPPYRLERLTVQQDRRYATSVYVPVDVTVHGDPNRKPWVYIYTPRQPLEPGEYTLTLGGVIAPSAGFGSDSKVTFAFRVVAASAPTKIDIATIEAARRG